MNRNMEGGLPINPEERIHLDQRKNAGRGRRGMAHFDDTSDNSFDGKQLGDIVYLGKEASEELDNGDIFRREAERYDRRDLSAVVKKIEKDIKTLDSKNPSDEEIKKITDLESKLRIFKTVLAKKRSAGERFSEKTEVDDVTIGSSHVLDSDVEKQKKEAENTFITVRRRNNLPKISRSKRFGKKIVEPAKKEDDVKVEQDNMVIVEKIEDKDLDILKSVFIENKEGETKEDWKRACLDRLVNLGLKKEELESLLEYLNKNGLPDKTGDKSQYGMALGAQMSIVRKALSKSGASQEKKEPGEVVRQEDVVEEKGHDVNNQSVTDRSKKSRIPRYPSDQDLMDLAARTVNSLDERGKPLSPEQYEVEVSEMFKRLKKERGWRSGGEDPVQKNIKSEPAEETNEIKKNEPVINSNLAKNMPKSNNIETVAGVVQTKEKSASNLDRDSYFSMKNFSEANLQTVSGDLLNKEELEETKKRLQLQDLKKEYAEVKKQADLAEKGSDPEVYDAAVRKVYSIEKQIRDLSKKRGGVDVYGGSSIQRELAPEEPASLMSSSENIISDLHSTATEFKEKAGISTEEQREIISKLSRLAIEGVVEPWLNKISHSNDTIGNVFGGIVSEYKKIIEENIFFQEKKEEILKKYNFLSQCLVNYKKLQTEIINTNFFDDISVDKYKSNLQIWRKMTTEIVNLINELVDKISVFVVVLSKEKEVEPVLDRTIDGEDEGGKEKTVDDVVLYAAAGTGHDMSGASEETEDERLEKLDNRQNSMKASREKPSFFSRLKGWFKKQIQKTSDSFDTKKINRK